MKEEKEEGIPKAEHLGPVFITNFRVLLFGSNYYIYDYTKFDLVKNEDGSVMTAFWQEKSFLNEAKSALDLHCQKLIAADYKRQAEAFDKMIATLRDKRSGVQRLKKKNQ